MPQTSTSFADIVRSRHSIRRFLPRPVERDLLLELLDLAACAPSGVNTQPWKVYIVTGKRKEALTQAILEESRNPTYEHRGEYDYYPEKWAEPYLSRRRHTGYALYSLLGIEKKDTERMHAQWARNYAFFDAPVGLIFGLDRSLGQGSLIDYGGFLQTLMLAARARGLDTCLQAAFTEYHPSIHKLLDIPDTQMIVCGMSMGYADLDAPENALALPRIGAREFTRFYD
jgi:nitroreductase